MLQANFKTFDFPNSYILLSFRPQKPDILIDLQPHTSHRVSQRRIHENSNLNQSMHPHPSLILLITTTIFSALLLHAGPVSPLPSSPPSSTLPRTSPNSIISTPSSTNSLQLLPRDRQARVDHPEWPYARCFCRLRAPWKCYIYNIINTPPAENGDPIIQRLEKNLSKCSRLVRLINSYVPTGKGGAEKGEKSGLTPMAIFRIPLHVEKSCVEMAVNEATHVKNGVGCIFSRLSPGGHSTGREPY